LEIILGELYEVWTELTDTGGAAMPFMNAATIKYRLKSCTVNERSRIEDAVLRIGADFPSFLLECDPTATVGCGDIPEKTRIIAVFKMAGPYEYYIHCTSADLSCVERIAGRLLRAHRLLGEFLMEVETAVGIPIFINGEVEVAHEQ
jgi:hypothetical protein